MKKKKTSNATGSQKDSAPRKTAGPSFAPAKPLDILVREEVDGEVYVMPVKRNTKHYFVIDGIAAELWSAFDGKTTLQEHIDRLARSHDEVPATKIKKDVNRFVAELKKLGLVD